MAKISTYPSADNPLLLSDRLIGTEAIRPVPSPTPLATKNFSLGELLQLFSSNFPAASLQAVLNTGNTATQNINLIGTIDVTLIKPENIEDAAGSQGATFQYLSKGASSINWVDLPVDNLQSVLNSGNTATQNITLVGNISTTKVIPGDIQDQTGSIGTTGQLLSKTSTGIKWISSTPTPPPALADVLFMGNTATNNINLIGDVTATRFIKTGGTSLQYLMADGSVTIADSSVPTLQQVTTEGNTTSNPIEINNISAATALNIIFSDEANGVIINTNTGYGSGLPFALLDEFTNTIFSVSHNAVVFANSFVKSGGTSLQYLMADGSVTTGGGSQNLQQVTDVGNVTTNDITAAHLIKDGGVSSQFLKADGSVDNNIYLTSADLPATLDLFATTYASDILGYTVLVRNIMDARFNTVAVDVSTGPITTTAQLVGSLISDANIISGNPGIFNITTIGNISRTSGTGQAEFFFRVYKRTSLGVETFITESSKTLPVTNGGYVEFSAVALWNDGVFLDTDRVVLKYYADRLTNPTGSNPTYKFQFGGISPVRSTAAIPTAVLPNIYLRDLADVENVDALNNEVLYWNDADSLWEHSLVVDLIPDASATEDGLVTTGTQTLAGAKTFSTAPILSSLTASQLLATDASKNIQTLDTATYPSLTELSYSKGVISPIQTQIDLKATKLMAANTIRVNNTAVAADAQEIKYFASGIIPMTETISFTAGAAPSNPQLATYNWTQVGNMVDVVVNLNYLTSGTTVTLVSFPFPSSLPEPLFPTGYLSASSIGYTGVARAAASFIITTANASNLASFIRVNSSLSGYEFVISAGSGTYQKFSLSIKYFTA
jgi:hypothetical protein